MNTIQTETSPTMPAMATGSGTALDIVFIIDTSLSMADKAKALSDSFNTALDEAQKKCPSQLRSKFFGVQGTWPGTKFDQSLSDYLIALGIDRKNLQARDVGSVPSSGAQEDLARAVIDCCTYHDWLPGASRAIFVLGDEALEGGGCTVNSDQKEKNNEAIACAQKRSIKVYTYQGKTLCSAKEGDALTEEYRRLAEKTGGLPYIYTKGTSDFSPVLQEILCDSLKPPVNPPDLKLPDGDSSRCTLVCDQLPTIIKTIQMLAMAINKVIDACCQVTGKDTFEDPNKKAGNCNCGCGEKKS